MAETKNLCAQVPIDLHDRVSQAKDQAGQTTSQYITELLIEYFRLHRAIVTALNEYGAIRQDIQESALELAGMAQDYGVGGSDLLTLRQRLDELTAEQALLLDKVLEDMDNPDLNVQLKALAEEKQSVLEQMAALQEKAERQALQASRRRELEEWLERQPMMFTEFDDGVTRRLVERITVVDAETIWVKLKDTDVEIEQKLC